MKYILVIGTNLKRSKIHYLSHYFRARTLASVVVTYNGICFTSCTACLHMIVDTERLYYVRCYLLLLNIVAQ